jgi:hypothetical protein
MRLAAVVIGCLIVLAVVGVILKLVLDDIGRGDAAVTGTEIQYRRDPWAEVEPAPARR